MLTVFTAPGPLRRFLLASLQSSVGNSVAYVALLLVAYQQLHSPWAITLILMAEFLPALVAGNWFGALADRYSRKRLAVGSDVVRCLAFAGLALSHAFELTLLLAVVAGTAQAMFGPASKSALPAIAGDRTEEGMGGLVFGISFGNLAGPAIGAAVLLVSSADTLLWLNAVSFAVSGVVLAGLPLDGTTEPADAPQGHDVEPADHSIRAGIGSLHAVPGLWLVVIVATGATLSFSMMNVAEPLLAAGPLRAGSAGFALLVALFGLGSTVGSATGGASTGRMLAALFGTVVALAATAVVPSLALAAVTFTCSGYFGGMLMSSEQRLLSTMVPAEFQGRVYGFKDSLDSGAFVIGYLVGGGLATATGPRWIFAIAAGIAGLLGAAALLRLRTPFAAAPFAPGARTEPPRGT